MMARPSLPLRALALLAVIALLGGCAVPTYNPWKLRAIRVEAQSLMARYPVTPSHGWVEVPKSEWPPVIASLRPELVTVDEWRVHIWIKPFFDGGWGYSVRRDDRGALPRCHSALGQGVLWHTPC
jgi:hypothetical protein